MDNKDTQTLKALTYISIRLKTNKLLLLSLVLLNCNYLLIVLNIKKSKTCREIPKRKSYKLGQKTEGSLSLRFTELFIYLFFNSLTLILC